ncbi:MAG: GNAT family N-acetyltransferase [Candidatus Tyrphobacter sp.]
MQQTDPAGPVRVVSSRACRNDGIVEMFRASFPRHPLAVLDPGLANAFLDAFAARNTLWVASNGNAPRAPGFLIGGETAALDAVRRAFIHEHAPRIALASVRNRALRRLVIPRLLPAKSYGAARFRAYQLRFIAVDASERGTGIGSALVCAFEKGLADADGYHAWTMAGPTGAEGFFARLGFVRDFAVGAHLRMIKRLKEHSAER